MASVYPLSVLLLGVTFTVLTSITSSRESPKLVILVADLGRDPQPASLHMINLHHLNLSTIEKPFLISPMAIEFDEVGEHIYWTDITMKQVRRADVDGGKAQVISQLHATSSPKGLTVDSGTRHMFYTDDGADSIVKVQMNTLVTATIIDTGLHKPRGIVADTRYRRLYWVDRGNASKIETSDYMGDLRKTLVSSDLHFPNDITLDENAGRLYWTDTAGYIGSILVDGSDRKTVLSQGGTNFFFISFYNELLYYTVFGNDTINIISADGIYWAPLKASTIQSCAGIHVFSPSYNNSAPCPDGQYGNTCDPCGHCAYICEKTTGLCYGGCSPGYTGDKCTAVCTPGTFGDECGSVCFHCNTGSVCDPVTGQCPDGCQPGWRGSHCHIACDTNTHGELCVLCGYCAGGVSCDQVSGVCPDGCQYGWIGDKCDRACQPNTYGTSCASCGHCAGGAFCNRSSGLCPTGCQDGWTTLLCNIKCPDNTYGASCAACGFCAGGVSCDNVSGNCEAGCHTGWTGEKCDRSCQPNTYGTSCASCGHCAGGAFCNRSSGLCPTGCQDGWTTLLCNIKTVGATAENQTSIDNADGIPPTGTLIGIASAGILLIVGVVAVTACVLTKGIKRRETTDVDTDFKHRNHSQHATVEDSYTMYTKNVSSVHILQQDGM
ncbi:multiple epidermal growth factor-like domains protein 10 [Haliotis rufescens]|uniref:multiple epidermal growth factor-like domains protein 10 n=1 Tax=Haliotis rufescens TaxID=6454 RepID=UPI00201EE81A|nr:multiple epidermal growth factor-like domains protein 10 [Haliotis rufescens]